MNPKAGLLNYYQRSG